MTDEPEEVKELEEELILLEGQLVNVLLEAELLAIQNKELQKLIAHYLEIHLREVEMNLSIRRLLIIRFVNRKSKSNFASRLLQRKID